MPQQPTAFTGWKRCCRCYSLLRRWRCSRSCFRRCDFRVQQSRLLQECISCIRSTYHHM